MMRLLNIILGTVIIMGFSQCGSSQKLVDNPPFVLGEVKSEPWTAGANKEANGVNVYLPVENENGAELDSLYYQNKVVKLERIKKDNYLYLILMKKKLNKLLTTCIKIFIHDFYLCGKKNKHVI